MEAIISREGEITVIQLRGHLEFEAADPFRRSLDRLIQERIVFDFLHLSFVGSSGITLFVELLKEFAEKALSRPKFSGVGSEFRKVFAASQLAPLEIYDSSNTAARSFYDSGIQPLFFLAPRNLPAFGEGPEWLEDDPVGLDLDDLDDLDQEVDP